MLVSVWICGYSIPKCTQWEPRIVKLTDAKLRAAKPTDKDQMLSDGNGLYLRIRPGGSKTWIIRKKHLGKTSITRLNKYPDMSLKEARLKAAAMAMTKHVNSTKVNDLVEKYMNEVIIKSHKRVDLVKGYMDRAIIPQLGNRKVRDITRAELVAVIQQYSSRGARTADQLRSNLKKLFSYATELGVIDINPMNDVSRRVTGYKPISRDRVLSDDEIRLIWGLEHQNARLLRFLLLTGLRITEARKGYREGDRWIVPVSISKNSKAHWVYLTDEAVKQLPLPKCSATNIQAWLRRLLDKHDITPRFTPHDFRRTAATRMADSGVEPFIVERVLNHTLEGVMAVYNRAEYEPERIEAAESLGRHINDIVGNQG